MQTVTYLVRPSGGGGGGGGGGGCGGGGCGGGGATGYAGGTVYTI